MSRNKTEGKFAGKLAGKVFRTHFPLTATFVHNVFPSTYTARFEIMCRYSNGKR